MFDAQGSIHQIKDRDGNEKYGNAEQGEDNGAAHEFIANDAIGHSDGGMVVADTLLVPIGYMDRVTH